ncbi:unnamed protein product [Vitrella brassicaformis CCMP3155]|uniref:Thioredoxin domain-containing protein n=2 Tax=Vitrella brassicaformis TaxID=1169539 RepID=A0A0G4EID1_VITBC|nr:unnamed protein product [Vitrella brassicaformis CCMP3155]|eukprot:CEL95637.1 unnamed protein product [Vitrella brassicaformis CCMP3155]
MFKSCERCFRGEPEEVAPPAATKEEAPATADTTAPATAKKKMGFNLGDVFPNFQAQASGVPNGEFDLYKYWGDGWGILFSHPADYTPVCTTELGKAAKLAEEFAKRNCKLCAISCNDKDSHEGWSKDIISVQGMSGDMPFPIIADPTRAIATGLGIMDPEEKDKQGLPLTCRSVFYVSPDRKLKAQVLYPATTGRDFSELLRVLDSLQLTSKFPVATPEGWQNGSKCMVVPSLTDDDAKTKLAKGFEKVDVPSGKNYIRMTPDPR